MRRLPRVDVGRRPRLMRRRPLRGCAGKVGAARVRLFPLVFLLPPALRFLPARCFFSARRGISAGKLSRARHLRLSLLPPPPPQQPHHLRLAAAATTPTISVSPPPQQPPPSPSRRRQKEKMVHESSISCHADLQALQDRSDGRMFLKLVSLESVRIATDSYVLLRNLIERKFWRCPQIGLLSFVAGVAVELLNLSSLLEEATLGKGFPEALVLMKNSGMVLERLGKEAKKHLGEDAFLAKVEAVGGVLKCNADDVLNGTHDFAWFQSCLPGLLDGIGVLLSTQVYFPD